MGVFGKTFGLFHKATLLNLDDVLITEEGFHMVEEDSEQTYLQQETT